MFTLLYSPLYIIPMVIFSYFDGPQIVSTIVIRKYRKFRTLNGIVSKFHKNVFVIVWVSIVLILQSLFYTLSQRINKTVIKKREIYEVTYVIRGNKYKMRIPCKDIKPSSVFLIRGDNDTDITDDIEPFLGPYGDFHGKVTTPSMFNQSILIVDTIDGVSRTFQENEKIIV